MNEFIMRVEIISIGDELLIGQVVNTNAAWMGRELTSRGFIITAVTTVVIRVTISFRQLILPLGEPTFCYSQEVWDQQTTTSPNTRFVSISIRHLNSMMKYCKTLNLSF